MIEVSIHDDRACHLGEGPIWHPLRATLYWFDITAGRLLWRDGETPRHWQFDRMVSAAGWTDAQTLLIAGETGLFLFDLDTGAQTPLCAIEADQPGTRSNDGRADPHGGFWIGTMGKGGEAGAGALYRYYRGTLRRLGEGFTTPNSLCFSADGATAYFSDTRRRTIWRQALSPTDGWPLAEPEVFVDLRPGTPDGERRPDGAVIDAEGCLWNAQWGSGRVARYSPDGELLTTIALPAGHTSCPAFGGDAYDRLFVTSAQQNLTPEQLVTDPGAGQTFVIDGAGRGRPEPAVLI